MEHLLSAITILVLWLITLGIKHFTTGINRYFLIGNCLVGSLAVETAAIQTKPACAGLKFLVFPQSAKADFVCVDANSIRPVLDIANFKYHS